jgi:hypothetical protein
MAKASWLLARFDTFLKIARLFSYAVVRGTHELLMAKSEIRGIYVEETTQNLVCQPAGRRKNDFVISIRFGETGLFWPSITVAATRPNKEHRDAPEFPFSRSALAICDEND